MRIIHYSKTIGFGGTDKVAQIMCRHLARDPEFETYLLYNSSGDTARLQFMRDNSRVHLIPYNIEHEISPPPPYLPKNSNFFDVLNDIKPDILHLHRSGYREWPLAFGRNPNVKTVETNIFGYPDSSCVVDKHIYISHFIRRKAINAGNPDGPVLYNPTEYPTLFKMNPRLKFMRRHNIPDVPNLIIIGRVGRPDNFDSIALESFRRLQHLDNVYFAIVGACEGVEHYVKEHDIKRVVYVEPLVHDDELSAFLQSIDIYAHYRQDGECCPCNIQEAMIHGLPVISHQSQSYNGQVEIIAGCGIVVDQHDSECYAAALQMLALNKIVRDVYGKEAKKHAKKLFAADVIVEKLKEHYRRLLSC